MKLFLKMLAAATLTTAASSCSSFLDINTNPNAFTTATAPTPDAILAQALSITAANYTGRNPSFNTYASFAADYWGKSGVVNGFTEERTYNYTNVYYQNLWSNTYDNLNDYNVIQTQGATLGYPNHAAIARIMKVYNFLLLVDEYGDIPYTKALQGTANLTPTYDKAQDIYKDFIVQLTGAITDIDAAAAATTTRAVGSEDIVFAGNMTMWKRFANSLKLRILLRESQTSDATLNSYVATQMTALQASAATTGGFITADVVAQPGYAQSTDQQNPFYNRYGLTITGGAAAERSYQLPTNYALNQYINNNDPRVSQLYTRGSRTPAGTTTAVPQYVGTDVGEPAPVLFTGAAVGSRFLNGGGILKGYNAPTALMLLSEHLFSKAEAETRGLFTGGDAAAKTDYFDGIKASFIYYYRAAATTNTSINASTLTALTTAAAPGITQYNTYIAANPSNPLVDYDNAASNGSLGKQNVILYQKYLAENQIASTEAWDDFRRAAQPKIQISQEASQGKFPKRLFYPQTEINTNQGNVPAGVTQYTPIFWDVVD
ncbi:MAG: SusD/RagB family nutrient-binding outer membrane lipoprotein [Hymenobacter sp.]|nr:MAG: SusD/RagB family nutrient-binding outer membrane lipoprotein [Hymenobacter sp.]